MAFRLHSRYFLWFTLFVCFLIVVNNNEMSLFCSHKRYKDGAQGRIRLTLPNVNTTKNKKGQQCKHFIMTGMELVKGQPRQTMARVRSRRARAGCLRCFLLSQALSHSRKGQQPERRGLIFLSIVFFHCIESFEWFNWFSIHEIMDRGQCATSLSLFFSVCLNTL